MSVSGHALSLHPRRHRDPIMSPHPHSPQSRSHFPQMSDVPPAKTFPEMRAAPRTLCIPPQPPLSHPTSSSLALLSHAQSQPHHLHHQHLHHQSQQQQKQQQQQQQQQQQHPQPHALPQHLPNFLHSPHSHSNFKLFTPPSFSSAPISSAAPVLSENRPHPHQHHEQMLANTLSLSTLSPTRHTLLRPDPVSHLSPFPFVCAQSPTQTHTLASAPLPSSIPHPRQQDVYVPDDLAFHFPDSPVRSMAALDMNHSVLATPAAIDPLHQVRSVMDPSVPDIHLVGSATAHHNHLRTMESHSLQPALPDSRLPLGSPILSSPQVPQPSPTVSQAPNLSLSPDSQLKNPGAQTFHLQNSQHNPRLKQQHHKKRSQSNPQHENDQGHTASPHDQTQLQNQVNHHSHNPHHQAVSRGLHHHFGEHPSPLAHPNAYANTGNILQQRPHPSSNRSAHENRAKRHKANPKLFLDRNAHRQSTEQSVQTPDAFHNTREVRREQLQNQQKLQQTLHNRRQFQDYQQHGHHLQGQDQQDREQMQMKPSSKQATHFAQQKQDISLGPLPFQLQQQDNQENQPRLSYHPHAGHPIDHQASASVSHIHGHKKLNQHFDYRFQAHQNAFLPADKHGNAMDYTLERGVDMRPHTMERHATDGNEGVALSPSLSVGSGDPVDHEAGSPDLRQKIPCPHDCGKEYTRTHALNVHISTKHTGTNQEYQCTACNKKFNRKDTLKRHFATTHEQQRNWPCKECKKRFGQQAHLNTHVRTVHKKDRPHVCDQCPKSFGTLYNLNAHKNTHRRTQKAYACETCRKTYKIKSSLARHRRKEQHMELNSSLPNSSVEHATEEAPLRSHADSVHGMGHDSYLNRTDSSR